MWYRKIFVVCVALTSGAWQPAEIGRAEGYGPNFDRVGSPLEHWQEAPPGFFKTPTRRPQNTEAPRKGSTTVERQCTSEATMAGAILYITSQCPSWFEVTDAGREQFALSREVIAATCADPRKAFDDALRLSFNPFTSDKEQCAFIAGTLNSVALRMGNPAIVRATGSR